MTWRRFRKHRVAVASGILLLLLFGACFGTPLILDEQETLKLNLAEAKYALGDHPGAVAMARAALASLPSLVSGYSHEGGAAARAQYRSVFEIGALAELPGDRVGRRRRRASRSRASRGQQPERQGGPATMHAPPTGPRPPARPR